MNPRALKIIAFVLIGLSLLLAYAGFRMSQQPATPQQVQQGPEMPFKVVVAADDLEPNQTIEADDLQLVPYPIATAGSYDDPQKLVGLTTHTAIRKGELFSESHFKGESLLSPQISAGHRAMAVTVDETVGTGGFLNPGDRVDVIYSSRANKETNGRSVARRIIHDVKVLAFGNIIKGVEEEEATGKRSRTAVLEVPEDDISKLLLAETFGVLRLVALGDGDMRGGDLADASAQEETPAVEDTAAVVSDLTGWKGSKTPRPTVYVYSGDSVETVRTTP